MNILDLSTTFSADVSPFNNAMSTAAGQADAAFSLINSSAKAYLGSSGVCRYFVQATKAAADFGQVLADMAAISEVSIKQIHDSLLRLPNYFGDVSQQAQSMYEIISSGFRDLDAAGLERFQTVISKTAKVIRADVYATGNAITTLANAYKLNIDQVEKLTDWFYLTVREGKAHGDDLARTMGLVTASASEGGMKLRELGAAIAILSRTQSPSQSFIGLNQALNAIIKPTLKAQQAAKQWGIEISATRVQNEGLVPLLQELHDKVGGNVEALEQMFGNIRAGRAILTLTGKQFDDFIKVLGEFENMTGKGEEAFLKQIDTTKTAIQAMQTQFDKTSIVIGEDFGVLVRAVSGFGEAVAKGFAGLDKFDRILIYIATAQYLVKTIRTAFQSLSNSLKAFSLAGEQMAKTTKSAKTTNKEIETSAVKVKKATAEEKKRTDEVKKTAVAETSVTDKVLKTTAAINTSTQALMRRNKVIALGNQHDLLYMHRKYLTFDRTVPPVPPVSNFNPSLVKPYSSHNLFPTGAGVLTSSEEFRKVLKGKSLRGGIVSEQLDRRLHATPRGVYHRFTDPYVLAAMSYKPTVKANPNLTATIAALNTGFDDASLQRIVNAQKAEHMAQINRILEKQNPYRGWRTHPESRQAFHIIGLGYDVERVKQVQKLKSMSPGMRAFNDWLKRSWMALKRLATTGTSVSKNFEKWTKLQAQYDGTQFGTRYGVGRTRLDAVSARYTQRYGFAPGTGLLGRANARFDKFLTGGLGPILNLMMTAGMIKMAADVGWSIGRAIAQKLGTDETLFQGDENKEIAYNEYMNVNLRRRALIDRVKRSKKLPESVKSDYVFRLHTARTETALNELNDALNVSLRDEEAQRDEFAVRTGRKQTVSVELDAVREELKHVKERDPRTFLSADTMDNLLSNLKNTSSFKVPEYLKSAWKDWDSYLERAFLDYKVWRAATVGTEDLKGTQLGKDMKQYKEFVSYLTPESIGYTDTPGGREMLRRVITGYADSIADGFGQQISINTAPQSTKIPEQFLEALDDANLFNKVLEYALSGDLQPKDEDVKNLLNNNKLLDATNRAVLELIVNTMKNLAEAGKSSGMALKKEVQHRLEKKRAELEVIEPLMQAWSETPKQITDETDKNKAAAAMAMNKELYGVVPTEYYKLQVVLAEKELAQRQKIFDAQTKLANQSIKELKRRGLSDAEIEESLSDHYRRLAELQDSISKQHEKLQKADVKLQKALQGDRRTHQTEEALVRARISRGGASEMAMLNLRSKQAKEVFEEQRKYFESVQKRPKKYDKYKKMGLTDEEIDRIWESEDRVGYRRYQEAQKNFKLQEAQYHATEADIQKQRREYRNAFVQRTMEGVQSFSTERDVRGRMTNNALYHSVNLLSRIAPQFATAMSSSMNIGRTDISSYNTNRAVDAQRAVADALDTYIIDQRYANDNLGTNVAKILDTINTRQPVFLK